MPSYFRADASFANPEVYEYLDAEGFEYAIRLPTNDALLRDIEPLLTRPVGRRANAPVVWYAGFCIRQRVGVTPAAWWPRRRGTTANCSCALGSS